MKTEEVIELARMAGAHDDGHRFEFHQRQYLEAFATEVERRTLERAAVVFDLHAHGWEKNPGENPQAGFIASNNCAVAIRALKESK
jgi:hypothetical protein